MTDFSTGPWVLAVSKYLLTMGIFAFWLLMFQANLDLNLSLLPIAGCLHGSWITFPEQPPPTAVFFIRSPHSTGVP